MHHCTIYVVNSDAAYSAEETINTINLLSLPIKSLLQHIKHAIWLKFVMCYSHLEKHCNSPVTMCMCVCVCVCVRMRACMRARV